MKITKKDFENLKNITIKDVSNIEKILTKEEFFDYIEKTFLENKEKIFKDIEYSTVDLKKENLNHFTLNNVFQYLNIEIMKINSFNVVGGLTDEIKNNIKKIINEKFKNEILPNKNNLLSKNIIIDSNNLFNPTEKDILFNRLKEVEPIILRDVIYKDDKKEYKYDITINKNLNVSLSFLSIKDLALTHNSGLNFS